MQSEAASILLDVLRDLSENAGGKKNYQVMVIFGFVMYVH